MTPTYIQVNGIKYWLCEHCMKENEKGKRCQTCGCTVRQRRKKK